MLPQDKLPQDQDSEEIDHSTNKFVYMAIAPANWLAVNDVEVKYRKVEKQEIVGSLKKTSLALSTGALAKLGQLYQHKMPSLGQSAGQLDYVSKSQAKQIIPGVGRTGESSNYEFRSTLPPENIVKFVTSRTDEKTANEYMNGAEGKYLHYLNESLDRNSLSVQRKHAEEQIEGSELMKFNQVFVTSSQTPESVEIHGLHSGLIFYSKKEAIKCAHIDNFSMPIVQKPLSLDQTFGFLGEDTEDKVTVDISDPAQTLKNLNEKLMQKNSATEMMGTKQAEAPQLKEDMLAYLQKELDILKKLNDPQGRLNANVAALLINELKDLDVSGNNNNTQNLDQMDALMDKIQAFAYHSLGQPRAKQDWDSIKERYHLNDKVEKWDKIKQEYYLADQVRTYADNLQTLYAHLSEKLGGSSLHSSTFKVLDQLTGFNDVSAELGKSPSQKNQEHEIEKKPEKNPGVKMSARTENIIDEINKLKDMLSAKINKDKDKPNFKASHKTKFLVALIDAIKANVKGFQEDQSEFIKNFIDDYKQKNSIEYANVTSGFTSRVNELMKILQKGEIPIIQEKGKVIAESSQDNTTFSFRPFR